jgi:hypothetical protein
LQLMPVELWRMVDEFSDAKTHTNLRSTCFLMRELIPREKIVEFPEYKELWEGLCLWVKQTIPGFLRDIRREEAFQAAVHLNPQTITQENYAFLYRRNLFLEIFRICRLAIFCPFTCSRSHNIDISACDNYAIRLAAQKGHSSVVALLLADPRVNPAADDNYAIRYASMNGHSDVVELLLADPRVDPAARNDEAYRFASKNGHSSVVALLLADLRVDPAAIYRGWWR